MVSSEYERRIAARFAVFDQDGNGYIDREDFSGAAKALLAEFAVAARSDKGQALYAGAEAFWQGMAGIADRDGDLVDTAVLLVSELATNAVRHASGRFRLTLFAAHGVLRCEVGDTGCREPRVRDTAAGAEESGRGMFLVDALARRWGCRRDGPGKTVWFELGTCGAHGCGRRQP